MAFFRIFFGKHIKILPGSLEKKGDSIWDSKMVFRTNCSFSRKTRAEDLHKSEKYSYENVIFLLTSNLFVQTTSHQNSLERIATSAKNGTHFASATVKKDNKKQQTFKKNWRRMRIEQYRVKRTEDAEERINLRSKARWDHHCTWTINYLFD